MKNSYYIINAHCHIYPQKIAARAVGATDKFYGVTSCCLGTAEDLLEREAVVGIDHFIVQSVATTPAQVGSINRFIADEVAKSEGLFTGLGTLHPDSDRIKEDVEEIVALGLHGVKLHPDIQQFSLCDERCRPIYKLCCEHRLPILMHTGDKRYSYSNPDQLIPVLKGYPELTVIGAHLGGYSVWEEAAQRLSGMENLYVDCSSSFFAMDKQRAKRVMQAYGADRILFGTDYPMWNAEHELDYLFDLGFSEDEYRKILSENAIKVFSLDNLN